VGSEEDAPVSSEEEKNKALVRRFWEAQANADLYTLDDLLASDFVDHCAFAGQEPGREGYKQQIAEQHAALSDARSIIEDQVAKGHKVVTRITWRSIHDRGEYFGLMPRGKEVMVTAMAMHRIVGARSSRNGARIAVPQRWRRRISTTKYASASSRTLGWHEATSRSHRPGLPFEVLSCDRKVAPRVVHLDLSSLAR
jgi:predicted ester cyclase